MKKQKRLSCNRWLLPVVGMLTTAILLASCAPRETATRTTVKLTPLTATTASRQTLSDSDIAEKISPAVAHVIGTSGEANGVMVDSRGYMLTNSESIAGDDNVTVELPGKDPVTAQVIYRDTYLDIAILKCPNTNYAFLTLGSEEQPEVGDNIVVLWYQPGSVPGESPLISRGAIHDFFTFELQEIEYISSDVTNDANSKGGPMVNSRGEIIGIMSRGITDSRGMNLAIDINSVLPGIEAMLQQLVMFYSWGG